MKDGTYTIFQYNGKDCFLQASNESFEMLTYKEIPEAVRENPTKWVGRKLKIINNKIELIMTPAEIQAQLDRKQRHVTIRRDIAGIEGDSGPRPDYLHYRLKALYEELAQYESLDPTAKTLEQQRANESITNPVFELKKPNND